MWLVFVSGQLVEYAPVLIFLFLFVRSYEMRGKSTGIRSLLSSVGWKKEGTKESLKWALVFLLIVGPLSLVLSGLQSLVAAGTGTASAQPPMTSIPLSSLAVVVVSAFATAVTEETAVRGYILDRLMPSHPSTLRSSTGAVITTSAMMTTYHASPYLNSYGFSPAVAAVGLLGVFVYSVFLSFAYVRSKVRNASGPIVFHFLLDAGFYIALFAVVG
jgi:membrane protease YdiL (CAAX protease family)